MLLISEHVCTSVFQFFRVTKLFFSNVGCLLLPQKKKVLDKDFFVRCYLSPGQKIFGGHCYPQEQRDLSHKPQTTDGVP